MKQKSTCVAPILAVALGLLPACRTVNTGSTAQAWMLDDNKAATDKFIIDTVRKYLPAAVAADSGGHVLQQFAQALEDEKTGQAESSEYVLEQYYKESQTPVPEGQLTPLEVYILTMFAILTNYDQVHDRTASALVYTGGKRT